MANVCKGFSHFLRINLSSGFMLKIVRYVFLIIYFNVTLSVKAQTFIIDKKQCCKQMANEMIYMFSLF